MKKVLMMLAVAGISSTVMAQSYSPSQSSESETPINNKYQVMTNTFWNNWFVSAGGGASLLFGDNDTAGKFGSRISSTVNLGVGKWFTPALGLRLQYSGLQARGFSRFDNGDNYVRGNRPGSNGLYTQRFYYMNLHGDVMVNLINLFAGYNDDRMYEITPYLGGGFTHTYSAPHRSALALNAGLINRFRVSHALDINLELAAVGLEDEFDGEYTNKHGFDAMLNLSLGLTYRFPTRTFSRGSKSLISASELADMRDRISRLAADRDRLRNALEEERNRPPREIIKEVIKEKVVSNGVSVGPSTVFFEIGSAKISQRGEAGLKVVSDNIKQTTANYVVTGYADNKTGSAAVNEALSLKRAQAVVKVLVNEYGIDESRLSTVAGGGVDTFGPDILNRIAIVAPAE
ncbi:MAG: OmpA family protein [Mediterranea sp.]|jgi:outer membrane protein OmpA-like peptidoglycan-associated protein|nr:OmpA family protein [Mediterranea sp.]